jgi:acetyl-CoA carboxylase biotin carboxyl carrier protein
LDWKNLRRLVRFMTRQDLVEIEVEEEGLRVRMRRREARAAPEAGSLPSAASPSAAPEPAAAPAPAEAGLVEFRSPMVGTFYRAPSPEAEPFVQPGSRIEPETVLCIIEAMKVMNEVRAETAGEVVAVLAENGEPVEFGQPLFRLRSP